MICGTKTWIKFDVVDWFVGKLILNVTHLCRIIDTSRKWTTALIKIPRVDVFWNKIDGLACMKWYDIFSVIDLERIGESLLNEKCK